MGRPARIVCQKTFRVLLHNIEPEAIRHLTELAANPAICVSSHFAVGRPEFSIVMHLMESAFAEDIWSAGLARCYGITVHQATLQVRQAAALLLISTGDRIAALEIVPRAIQTLMHAHDGAAWDGNRCWKSGEVRRGSADFMASWPFPTTKDEYERCVAVALGEIVARYEPGFAPEDTKGREYDFNGREVLRGNLPASIKVFSRDDEFPLVVGKDYLLFLFEKARGGFTVDARGNSDALPAVAITLSEVRALAAAQHTSRK